MEVRIKPLAEVFSDMRDRREWHWHDMGTTLTLIFLAMLSGEDGLRGIAGWLQEQRWRLGKRFGIRGGRMPSYGTIRRVLGLIDVAELEGRLGAWAAQFSEALPGKAWEGVAADGKSLRGSATDADKAVHLLSIFSHHLEIVLGQRAVEGKTNEIPELRTLLEEVVIEGKLVTMDALHTQRDTAETILEKGGPI